MRFFSSYLLPLPCRGGGVRERLCGQLVTSQGQPTTAIKKIFSHLTPNLSHTPETGAPNISSGISSPSVQPLGSGPWPTPQRCLLLALMQETGWKMEVSLLLPSIRGTGWVQICSANTIICELSLSVEQNRFPTVRF